MMANFGSDRRSELMAALLQDKGGLTVEALSDRLGITRTAVRQHLATLERDGHVARSGTRATGGRPEMLYALTETGAEQFARRYSWFADLLVGLLKGELGEEKLRGKLRELGAGVATALRGKAGAATLAARLAELSAAMRELGYETDAEIPARGREVVARNCIFHQLAAAHPEVCEFDLGFMSKFANAEISHEECMARGAHVCRFRFHNKPQSD